MNEIWKEIPGYEGLYKMSSKLRVYDIKNDCFKEPDERFGYLCIRLTKGKVRTTYKFSKVVALTFVPIPDDLKNVPLKKLDAHHIDGNRLNNDPSNLMFVTHAKHMEIHKAKTVYQYNLNGGFIKQWVSAKEIERELGYSHNNISKCCKGNINYAYGFQWSFDYTEKLQPVKRKEELVGKKNSKAVAQYTLDGHLIKVWPSMSEVFRQLGYSHISDCCKGKLKQMYGYIWKYA